MTVKEHLETFWEQFQRDYTTIEIIDYDYLQGCVIFTAGDLENVLQDKPVKKYLDYIVLSVADNDEEKTFKMLVRKEGGQ